MEIRISAIGNRQSRLFRCLVATAYCLLFCCLLPSAFGQNKTTVTGTLDGPDGSPATGFLSIVATVPFTSADGYNVFAGPPIHVTIASGAFSASLIPNAGSSTASCSSSPCDYYQVTFNLTTTLGNAQWTQLWFVPASGPVAYQTIVQTSPPSVSYAFPFAQLAPPAGCGSNNFPEWTGAAWTCSAPTGSGNVTISGSPVAGNVAAFSTSSNIVPATAANIVALFGGGACTGYLQSTGGCSTPSGGSMTWPGAAGVAIYSGSSSWSSSLSTSGSGTTLCLTVSCVMTTPNLGTPSAVNLGNATFPASISSNTTGNAATATALAALPAQCSGNNFATGVTASGAANCSQPAFSNLSGSATNSQLPSTLTADTSGNAATATNLASYPTICTGSQFSQGLSLGSNNCATPAGSSPLTTEGDLYYYHSSANARLGVGANGQVLSSNGTDPAWIYPGFSSRSVSGASDTIASTDCGAGVLYSNATGVAESLPTATTLGVAACATQLTNIGAGTVTVSPTTWQINGSSTLAIAQGEACFISVNPAGGAWDAGCSNPPISSGTGVSISKAAYGWTVSATGATASSYAFDTENELNTSAVSATLSQNAVQLISFYLPPTALYTFSTMYYYLTTGATSTDSYDFGVYGGSGTSGCTSGNTAPLVAHTGTITGTTLGTTVGNHSASFSGAPISSITGGWYCVALTTSTSGATAILGGSGSSYWVQPFTAASSIASVGGSTLPSTITAPTLNMGQTKMVWVMFR